MNDEVKKEVKRLRTKVYAELDWEENQGLIERAAYLRIMLQEIEKDLEENGRVDMFQQSEKLPGYERERPAVNQYSKLSSNYLNTLRQLDTKLQKLQALDVQEVDDGFDNFVERR